jgi:hypothetical protein
MSRRGTYLSIAAGVLTPLPLLLLFTGLQSAAAASGAPVIGWKISLVAAFLFALAIALCRPLRPAPYAGALAPAFAPWYFLLAGATRSSNLFGLALILVGFGGVAVAVSVALLAAFARRRQLPAWIPAVPAAAAALLLMAGWQSARSGARVQSVRILALLQQIQAAEQAYAAASPSHGYTCNGPDLSSVKGVDWRADYNLGGADRNQAEYDGYWILLRCEPAAHSTWVTATATALWQGGPVVAYDSRRGTIAAAPRR